MLMHLRKEVDEQLYDKVGHSSFADKGLQIQGQQEGQAQQQGRGKQQGQGQQQGRGDSGAQVLFSEELPALSVLIPVMPGGSLAPQPPTWSSGSEIWGSGATSALPCPPTKGVSEAEECAFSAPPPPLGALRHCVHWLQ